MPATSTHRADERHDTPARGWERGVWNRIGRRRRIHRLGALALAAVAIGAAVILAQRLGRPEPFPARVSAELDRPPRMNGSAPLHAVWNLRFEGAELRVYRDERRVVRCPGSAGCTRTDRGGTLALAIDAPGEYRALVFTEPGAGDGASLRRDLVAASEDGNPVQMSPPLIAY